MQARTHTSTASLRALMSGLIDYAGLFPPAALPMAEAVKQYAAHRKSAERWMLSRFVVPAARLEEFSAAAGDLISDDSPVGLVIIGRGGSDERSFAAGLQTDLRAIESLRRRHGERVQADVLEVRLPETMLSDSDQTVEQAIQASTNAILTVGLKCVFYEVPFDELWQPRAVALIPILAVINNVHGANIAGFKLRCGGTQPFAFPSPRDIDIAIGFCGATGVPLKATAGLHHPIRHFDTELGCWMHGFLNVFGAGVLAATCHLGTNQIEAVIIETEASAFTFTDEALSWRNYRASTEEIAEIRANWLIAFGSCSFDDPVNDLRQLGLL